MKTSTRLACAAAVAAAALAACSSVPNTPQGRMTFFVTSANPGNGGDLGGLAGADRHCQALATAAGAGNRTWRAYLSAQPLNGVAAVNARDRIGRGPWQNVNGTVVATSVENLHGDNNINKQTALTEKGQVVSGRGDPVNMHDILTGSQPQGTYIAGDVDSTCGNWTRSGAGAAMTGHHDRIGLRDDVPSKSWNSSHQSSGCSMEALKSTGGAGLLYCFAEN
jgi:hypothetical protein